MTTTKTLRILTALSVVLIGASLSAACNPTGSTTCTGVSETADTTANTCAYGFYGCVDGRTYQIVCNGVMCSCEVDGNVEATASVTSCPVVATDAVGRTAVNAACSWDIR